ncbi:hypothetical protein PHYPSEUDO_009652 [Phytophthora pseudosyringae]|uniref:Uncharacterized protein n=1 Tax=Phytophthora pseudosyringae TaxID=221518 RepID=A0A8T1WLZ8_9STRA|nr:hypothetical protein PHYPSEUDO_009652 [Phytophthora pseudosyringae]
MPRRQLTDPLPYSTDRHKTAELHALRSEAQQLAAKMEHLAQALENREQVDTTAELRMDSAERRKWHSRILVECEEQVRAQRTNRTNRELKALLMEQFKLFQSVRKELRQGDALDGMEFVERLQPTADRPFFRLDVSAPILSELSSKLEQLSLQADFVVPAVSQNLTGAFHTQSRCLATSGNCIEMTSTTALECSAPEAADILWRLISNKDNEAVNKIFSFVSLNCWRWM